MKAPFNCYAIYVRLPAKTDDPSEVVCKSSLTAIVTAIGNDGYAIKELILSALAFNSRKSAKVLTFNEGNTIPKTLRE